MRSAYNQAVDRETDPRKRGSAVSQDGTLMQAGVKSVLILIARYVTSRLGTVALAGACGLSGACVATTAPPSRAIIVTSLPPAPLVEERPPQPRPATVWIAGYWHWNGIQYAWIPGHWEASPHVGATWRAPRYVKVESSYVYEPGTWWTGAGQAPGAEGPASVPASTSGPSSAPNASISAFH
jgi:hypothetical protein